MAGPIPLSAVPRCKAAQQDVDRRPRLVVTFDASLSSLPDASPFPDAAAAQRRYVLGRPLRSMMRTDDVARELMPEEKVVWSGAPGKGIKFQSTDLVFIPFSLLWAGFAVFWEAT